MKETNGLRAGQLTFQGDVLHLMKNIVEREKLPFKIRQEEIDKKMKRPDLIVSVFKNFRWKNYCFVEIEDPNMDPYNSSLVEAAGYKAFRHGVEYFATWTVNEFVLWNTFEIDTPLMQRRQTYFDKYSVGLQAPTYEAACQKRRELGDFLSRFLKHLYAIHKGTKKVERPELDEFFIRRLNSVINPLSLHVAKKMGGDLHRNPEFRKKFSKWLRGERISGPNASVLGTERAARQFSYMLLDKIVFYELLRSRGEPLLPIAIHENLSGEEIRWALRKKFDDVTDKIDYESIFLTDFVDDLPIPDEVVPLLCRFVSELDEYDPYEICKAIGTIFQGVIPEGDRHVLGQYFTRSDVVDLIVGFCLRDPKSVVLDPACGAGTFLIRSYSRIKCLDPSQGHDDILPRLTGVDISKFPSHLSTMSLILKDMKARLNYPFVLHRDFFELTPKKEAVVKIPHRKVKSISSLLFGSIKKEYGAGFIRLSRKLGGSDVVVTNPPYTRQEEMEKSEFPKGYREKLKGLIEEEWNLPIGKRSSIYSHFFFHGGRFLKEGGRLGLITSNSWLDVDYGKYLQEFFLRNFKIVAVIESKLERWFEDADINTAITILERCNDEERRNGNIAKFVQLKKPLGEFVPTTDDEWEGWEAVDKFVDRIEATSDFVDDDGIRIFTKRQGELWNEGLGNGKYRGSKWGKYLRAPEIFFKILGRGKDMFIPLNEVAEVRRGFTTGANEFFYLTEEQIDDWGIEKEFWMHRENGRWVPNYVVKSPRECKSVIVNPEDLKYRVLMIHKDKKDLKGTNVLKYIERGEERGFHKRPTCASRSRWYELEKIRAHILSRRFIDTTFDFFANPDVFVGDTFFCVYLKRGNPKVLSSILNSSLYSFLVEAYGRTVMGQGVLLMYGPEIAPLPVYDLSKLQTSQIQKLEKAFEKLSQRPIGSVFEEICAERPEKVSLDKVKPDRRELDEIVMGEILGLTEDEQLEVYRAVVDLVRSRIERARSVKKRL